jgi:hypothetical protein
MDLTWAGSALGTILAWIVLLLFIWAILPKRKEFKTDPTWLTEERKIAQQYSDAGMDDENAIKSALHNIKQTESYKNEVRKGIIAEYK